MEDFPTKETYDNIPLDSQTAHRLGKLMVMKGHPDCWEHDQVGSTLTGPISEQVGNKPSTIFRGLE